MIVFRKISRAKWEPINTDSISADAITGDLRTQGNKLSLWQFDSAADENLDKVGLILATNLDDLAPIDITWIDKEKLSPNIAFEATSGDTPILSLQSFHIDAVNIDLDRLGSIARAYFEAFHSGNCKRLSRLIVKGLIKSAIKSGDLKEDNLNKKLAKKIQA